jgi:hypothetical protein
MHFVNRPMSKKNPLTRILAEAMPLTAVAIATVMLLGFVMPASAQFFLFGAPRPPAPVGQPQRGAPPPSGGSGLSDTFPFFSPFGPPQQQRRAPVVDYSRAPPPAPRDTVADNQVVVLGDAMADWLASGLEDAFSERPEMGVVRRGKLQSGLIHYQAKGDPVDWAAAAKSILPSENPAAIVIMLGLNDRVPIAESATDKSDAKKKNAKSGDKPADDGSADNAANSDSKNVDAELPPDDDSDSPSIITPEKQGRSANGMYEFRSDKWTDLYTKKVDELIAIAKSRGAPVLWVGLPAVRGTKAMSDVLYLDAIYRDAAGRAGITYVDVWDGFVDDAGRFLQQGPDFEGQIRRLRSADGVYFTKPGARKLAHYVDREIQRLLSGRTVPLNIPSEPAPEADIRPNGPAPRPLAGPVVPLVASSVGTDELLGGAGSRPPAVDDLAARVMVKGEPLDVPAGRADDFTWPRRDVGHIDLGKDVPVASTNPSDGTGAAQKQKGQRVVGTRPLTPAPGTIASNQQPQQPPSQRGRTTAQKPPPYAGSAPSWIPGFLR